MPGMIFQDAAPEPIVSSDEWSYLFEENVARGANYSQRSESLRQGQLLEANNVRIHKDQLLVDYGYKTFGGTELGRPRATYEFFSTTGTTILTLITNSTFYRWSSAVLEWQIVSNGTDTTLTADADPTDTNITVSSISGFSNGEWIGIVLDDGTQHKTTINGTPSGNNIPITNQIPSIGTSGNAVVNAVILTGDDDIGISITTWAATDKMYFANGTDAPKEYNGTTCEDISGLPANTTAYLVTVFNNFLFVMNTAESGTVFPQRVRWTEPGVDNNWNTSVNYTDLYEQEDWVTAVSNLGSYMIIYKERSIVRVEYVGTTEQTWQFTSVIQAEGALNQDAVVNLGDTHIIFGNSNIYEYDGGFSIDPIGDDVYEKIFSQQGELNPGFGQRAFGFYVEELDEVWFLYAAGDDETPKNMVKYNVANRAWTSRTFPINMTGYGFFQSTGDITWAGAAGTWAAYTGPWISKQTQASAPTLHLLSSDKQVYEYDYITALDDGAAIAYTVVTRDYYVPDRELRFDRYEFRLKGTSILIEASFDRGSNYETLGTVSPGNEFVRVRLFKQVIGRHVRFRFTGSTGFGFSWLGFRFKPESIF